VSTVARLWRELTVRSADLIVLEHRLPDGSGLDLLAVPKARRPEVPVIMATASSSEAICAAASSGSDPTDSNPPDCHAAGFDVTGAADSADPARGLGA
jgi:CheY-like chemotaxis protein